MSKRKRGRPRKYDPDRALDAATDVFWSRGFAATSLDALGEATGMQRPSLYAAFGDKGAIFERALARFRERMAQELVQALGAPRVDTAIERLFAKFVDVYAPASGPARGCLIFSVASLEAAEDAQLRDLVGETIHALDAAIRERLDAAVQGGELPPGTDTATLARCVAGHVHTLSLRARAGESRRALRKLGRDGARLLLLGARSSTV